MGVLVKPKIKIVHVAPYFESGNPFGGPLSVAMNIVNQLNMCGEPAFLIASTRSTDKFIEGVHSKLFRGFRIYNNNKLTGLFSPFLIAWIIKNKNKIEILHIHLAREMNTMLSALFARILGIKYVIQTHGMIRKPKNRVESLFDLILTRRVLRNSLAVLYLTSSEKRRLETVEIRSKYMQFSNAIELNCAQIDFSKKKSEVIFISRIHRDKQPNVFVEIALEIALKYRKTQFSIIGPDGGNLNEVLNLISLSESSNVCYEGTLNTKEVQNRLLRSSIFVLPTLGDVFPIAILEAMASGCAIVTTSACEISNIIEENQLGVVTSPSKWDIRKAIEFLINDPYTTLEMGNRAHSYALKNFDIKKSTQWLLSNIYRISDRSNNV